MIDFFRFGINFGGDFVGGFGVGGQVAANFVKSFDEGPGCFFTGLDTGLMIGVDVDE